MYPYDDMHKNVCKVVSTTQPRKTLKHTHETYKVVPDIENIAGPSEFFILRAATTKRKSRSKT